MRVIITGGDGFVGKETIKYMQEQGVTGQIDVFDIMHGGDIRNREFVFKTFEQIRPDRVLHLAAIARFADADADPKLAFETNVIGTKNVVDACKKFNIPLVYASTGSVYMPIKAVPESGIDETLPAQGNSVYGCTKYLGELYVKEHTPHIILRYAHLYGREKRGHGLIGGFLDRIKRGLEPTLYGGQQSNDFTYVKDVAQANLLALSASWDKWNQVYNIGTGEELTAEQAGKAVCDATGYTGKIEVVKGREVDAARFVYDISKAKRMLGFEPKYTFADGLKDMFSDGNE